MKEKARLIYLGLILVVMLVSFVWYKKRIVNTEGEQVNQGIEEMKSTDVIELSIVFGDGNKVIREEMDTIINRFNETHSNIAIRVQSSTEGSYSEFLRKKYYSNQLPDIMEMREVTEYVEAGAIAPLSEEITVMFRETTEINGKVYCVPISEQITNGLIYNKKYFKEKGLEEPTTYEGFFSLCEKINRLGDMTPLVIAGKEVWTIEAWFNKIYHGQVTSVQPNFIRDCYRGKTNFLDPTIEATITQLQRIFQYAQTDWAQTADSEVVSYLIEEKSTMLYGGTHLLQQIQKENPEFEIGWLNIPDPDGVVRIVGGASTYGFAISSDTAKDEKRKEAAEEFIRFFFQEENYREYCRNLFLIPSTKQELNLQGEGVYQEIIGSILNAEEQVNAWEAEVGVNTLPAGFSNRMYQQIIAVIQEKKGITEACNEINEIWKEQ